MNIQAAEAEMAIRDCFWGPGFGGTALPPRNFIQILYEIRRANHPELHLPPWERARKIRVGVRR